MGGRLYLSVLNCRCILKNNVAYWERKLSSESNITPRSMWVSTQSIRASLISYMKTLNGRLSKICHFLYRKGLTFGRVEYHFVSGDTNVSTGIARGDWPCASKMGSGLRLMILISKVCSNPLNWSLRVGRGWDVKVVIDGWLIIRYKYKILIISINWLEAAISNPA